VIGVFSFLTVFGRGRWARRPKPWDLVWFPIVGALIGLLVGAVFAVADNTWGAVVGAALAVLADLIVTGLLHFDGLADSADGLLPHLTKERRLEVMSTPGVGAFGVTTVATALVLRWAVFAESAAACFAHGQLALAVAGVWTVSRGIMAVTVSAVPYARAEGLASAFGGVRPARALLTAIVTIAIGLPLLMNPVTAPRAVVTFAVMALTAGLVVWFAYRRVGGYTGDVLGAAGIVAEIAGLLALTAR
jgi:adenosylcobinamide-GDP ribazoletransferase